MSSNKTILKNTIYLYIRMFLILGVGLYTSRLILKALGIEDYGIYGVVGGIVTIFAFLNSAMTSSTQRYLSFDIGKGDADRLQKTFNASLNIHFLIAFVIFVLAETIGLWFINVKLVIPHNRMAAANWVYQFSIFTFALDIIQVPYNALLIARERMGVYAYISIGEAALKLVVAFIIVNAKIDRLILYGGLTFVAAYIIRMSYKLYCKKHFEESKYKFFYDKDYYIELISYSGWNLFGNIAAVARNQGSNILLNLFFGPVVNAAYSLSLTVQSSVKQFVNSFQVAANPQITIDYAKGNLLASQNLMFRSAKYSYFMMLLFIAPFIFNIDYIVHLWLGKIPPYAIGFMRLALIFSLIETISGPLMIGIQATGKIKLYQATVGAIVFMNFPLVWITLKYTGNPIDTYWIFCIISIISLVLRLYFLKSDMEMNMKAFFKQVMKPIVLTSLFVSIFWYIFSLYVNPATNFSNLIIESFIFLIAVTLSIVLLGISKDERSGFLRILNKKMF